MNTVLALRRRVPAHSHEESCLHPDILQLIVYLSQRQYASNQLVLRSD